MSIDYLSRPGRFTFYYDRRGVSVTDYWLAVRGERYSIAELHHLERARGPMPSPARTALLFGLAALVMVAPVAFVFNTPAAWAIAALTAAAAPRCFSRPVTSRSSARSAGR
jgi:hypothetical protein